MVDSGKGDVSFDWHVLLSHFIHPLVVASIEAMQWVDEPLSSPDLMKLLGDGSSTGTLSYHLNRLAEAGILEVTSRPSERVGAPEKSYFFSRGK